jgi:RNA polymerase sigma-70 factor (ECF subfamily)
VTARRLDEIDPASECAYIMGIAVRTASETRRTLRRRREEAAADGAEWPDLSDSPEALLDRKRARDLLDSIVGAMPLELQTIFVLRELEGLTLPEIAAIQGLLLGTATASSAAASRRRWVSNGTSACLPSSDWAYPFSAEEARPSPSVLSSPHAYVARSLRWGSDAVLALDR